MSGAAYPVLTGLVVIDSTNKTVRVTENGVSENLTLVEGVYNVLGDGGADDLVEAFRAMLQSHSGSNTYSAAAHFLTHPADKNVSVQFDRAGTHTFAILFGNAATTFDATLLGFPQTDTGAAVSQASTKSSSAVWVSNDIYRSLEPVASYKRKRVRALSGKVRAVNRAGEFRDRLWVQEYVEERRMNEEANTSDPAAAFNRFVLRQAGGIRFRWFDGVLESPSIGDVDFSSTPKTEVGSGWIFDDDFYPDGSNFATRLDGGPLYSFSGHLLPYVA